MASLTGWIRQAWKQLEALTSAVCISFWVHVMPCHSVAMVLHYSRFGGTAALMAIYGMDCFYL